MSICDNRIPMALRNHENGILWPINDEGKVTCNVTTNYTHVENRWVGENREITCQDNWITRIARQTYLRRDDHRIGVTSNAR